MIIVLCLPTYHSYKRVTSLTFNFTLFRRDARDIPNNAPFKELIPVIPEQTLFSVLSFRIATFRDYANY